MTFTPAEIVDLKRYLQTVLDRPRRMTEQACTREGVFLWCDDWEIIELLKYLFNGREMYYNDPPPNRLKHNPLWSKEAIASEAERLMTECGSAEQIITRLRERRDGTASRVS